VLLDPEFGMSVVIADYQVEPNTNDPLPGRSGVITLVENNDDLGEFVTVTFRDPPYYWDYYECYGEYERLSVIN